MNASITDRILYLLYGLICAGIITCLALDSAYTTSSSAAGRDVVTTTAAAGHAGLHPSPATPPQGPTMTTTHPQQTARSGSNGT